MRAEQKTLEIPDVLKYIIASRTWLVVLTAVLQSRYNHLAPLRTDALNGALCASRGCVREPRNTTVLVYLPVVYRGVQWQPNRGIA